jgi:hypothetical protein
VEPATADRANPDAIDAAIKIADETDWPAPELEG